MKLWFLEFRKMFLRADILILLLVLLIVNAFKIVLGYEFDPRAVDSRSLHANAGYSETEDSLEGAMTAESAKRVLSGYRSHIAFMQGNGEYSQENLCCYLIYPRYIYQYEYHLNMQKKLDEAEANIKFYNARGNVYSVRVNSLFLRCYDGRYINNYSGSDDFEMLFTYDFSTLLLLIAAFIFSFRLFSSERQSGMDSLLKTSRKGRKSLPITKMSCLFAAITCTALLLYAEDILVHSVMFHLNDWTAPVYSIESYRFSVYSGSLIGYYSIMCLERIVVLFCAGLFFSLVSIVFQGITLPVIIDLLVIAVEIVLSENITELRASHLLNLAVLLKPNMLMKSFNTVRIFDIPVPAPAAGAVIAAVLIAGSIAIGHFLYAKDISSSISQKRREKNDKARAL